MNMSGEVPGEEPKKQPGLWSRLTKLTGSFFNGDSVNAFIDSESIEGKQYIDTIKIAAALLKLDSALVEDSLQRFTKARTDLEREAVILTVLKNMGIDATSADYENEKTNITINFDRWSAYVLKRNVKKTELAAAMIEEVRKNKI